eukprot:590118-Rhodomonas_salina.2
MSGTDLGNAATRRRGTPYAPYNSARQYSRSMLLRACYAMSGTAAVACGAAAHAPTSVLHNVRY